MKKKLFIMVLFCLNSASLMANCSKKFFISDFHLNLKPNGDLDLSQVPNFEIFKKNIEFMGKEMEGMQEPCLVINGDPFNRDAIEPLGKPVISNVKCETTDDPEKRNDCLERIFGTKNNVPSPSEVEIKKAAFRNLVTKIHELSGKHKNLHIYSNFGDHETPKAGTGKKSIPSKGLLMMPLLEKYDLLGGKTFGCPLNANTGTGFPGVDDNTRIVYPFCDFRFDENSKKCVIDIEKTPNKDTACLQVKEYFKFLEKRGHFGRKTADDMFKDFMNNKLALDADLVLRRRTPDEHDPCPEMPFGQYNKCLQSRFSMEAFQTEKYKKMICEGWHLGGADQGPKIHVMKGDSSGSWIDRPEDCASIQNTDPESGHLAIFSDGEKMILRHTEAGFPGSKLEAMLYEAQLEKANQYTMWGEDRRYRFNQGDYWTKDDAANPANAQLLQITSDTHFSRRSLGSSQFSRENEFFLNIGVGHRGINTGTMSEFSLRNRNAPNSFYASVNGEGEHYASDMTPVILNSINRESFISKTNCANLPVEKRDGCLMGSLVEKIYNDEKKEGEDFRKNLRAFLSIIESSLPEKKDDFRNDFFKNAKKYLSPPKENSVFCKKLSETTELIHYMDWDTLYDCSNKESQAFLMKKRQEVYENMIATIKNDWHLLKRDVKAGLSSVLLSYANNFGPKSQKDFTDAGCGNSQNESILCYLMIPKEPTLSSYVDLSKMEVYAGFNPNNIFNYRMVHRFRKNHCLGSENTFKSLINLKILKREDFILQYKKIKEKTRNVNYVIKHKG